MWRVQASTNIEKVKIYLNISIYTYIEKIKQWMKFRRIESHFWGKNLFFVWEIFWCALNWLSAKNDNEYQRHLLYFKI